LIIVTSTCSIPNVVNNRSRLSVIILDAELDEGGVLDVIIASLQNCSSRSHAKT
jgi:hypothetical protein